MCIFWTPGELGGAAQGWPVGGGQRGGPGATEAIARRFFDFFRDVPRGMLGFGPISDQGGVRPGGRLEEVFPKFLSAPARVGGIFVRKGLNF